MGPKERRSTVLSAEEEALVVAFRKHTLLPLDDCLYALQASIPHLTRSSLHRLFQRHNISRLPAVEGDKPKKRFKNYPIGYFHIDIAELRTEDGKLYMFVAIDRVTKFAFARLEQKANRRTASAFLEALIEAVPYKIHTVLTDNGVQFTFQPRHRDGPTARYATHMFDLRCREHGIEHRLTKPNHPWTNGQVERMNRTIKEATVRRYYYDSHEPRTTERPSRGLPQRLQLCQAAQDPQRPHTLRIHLQALDRATPAVQTQSRPPHAGTEHLGPIDIQGFPARGEV
jgi:transposase InsO family protein